MGHWGILFFMILIIIIQSPSVHNIKAYILTAQDINPVHLGNLFLNPDLPQIDDSEAGDNVRTLSLSTAYYWIPLLLNSIGIPFESIVFVHALLGLPILVLGIYFLY